MSNNLKEILEASDKAQKALESSLKTLNLVQLELIKNAPEEQKKEIEKVASFSQSVISELKKGNLAKANEMINGFKYGG